MLNDKPGTKNQRPVKLLRTSFLKCSEQTTVEFVTKKPSCPCCRLIRLCGYQCYARGGRGPRDRLGTLIRNKNLESNFLTPGIRFQFNVSHLSWASTKSTKSTKSSQSASYFWIIISRSISKASFKMR